MEAMSANPHNSTSEGSDWSLVDCEEFQEPAARVTRLEAAGGPRGLDGFEFAECKMQLIMERMHQLVERVGDLEADGSKGTAGAGVQLPPLKAPIDP